MNVAVILAGGIGSRVGAKIPKQFIKVQGKPLLAYTLECYQNNKNIDAIEVVCHKGWQDEVISIAKRYQISKLKWLIEGGDSFQTSTMKGVFNLKEKITENAIIVLGIGVCPLTSDDVINDSIRVCQEKGNGIASQTMDLCTCIKDDEFSTVKEIVREDIKGFVSPWSFKFNEIYKVYQEAIKTDLINQVAPYPSSLFLALGKRLYFSKTDSTNFKITTKEDLDLFEGYLLLKEKRILKN